MAKQCFWCCSTNCYFKVKGILDLMFEVIFGLESSFLPFSFSQEYDHPFVPGIASKEPLRFNTDTSDMSSLINKIIK